MTPEEGEKGLAAAQEGSCFCEHHFSPLQSLQVPRESLVEEPFRQAGLWDCTAQITHQIHRRKFKSITGMLLSPGALLWVSAEERMDLAKQSHIYTTANVCLFPLTWRKGR